MSEYSEYFLNCPSSVAEVNAFEFFHPHFSKVYRVVQNIGAGSILLDENGNGYFYEYYPLSFTHKGLLGDLDYSLSVVLGDLGEVIPKEIDRVVANKGNLTKPIITHRVYRSDTLDLMQYDSLEVNSIIRNYEGAIIETSLRELNATRTGITYTKRDFSTL